MSNLDYEPVSRDDCIIHPNKQDKDGYTTRHLSREGKTFSIKSHRLAYQEAYGKIPEAMLVCHKCDNPPCINPLHLFLGTPADNSRDMVNKGRGVVPDSIGEANGRSKLNKHDIKMIRLIYKTIKVTQSKLAEQFGVEKNAICRIVNRKSWNHI